MTFMGAGIVDGCVGTTSDTIDRAGRETDGMELPAGTAAGTVDETADADGIE